MPVVVLECGDFKLEQSLIPFPSAIFSQCMNFSLDRWPYNCNLNNLKDGFKGWKYFVLLNISQKQQLCISQQFCF